MESVKVVISNDQKAVKVPTGIRLLIRRCCHAVLELEHFEGSAEVSVRFVDNEQIRELNNPPLFTEPQYDDMAAQTISRETGAPIYTLDPVVTGPETDVPLTYYEDRMRENMQTLLVALTPAEGE